MSVKDYFDAPTVDCRVEVNKSSKNQWYIHIAHLPFSRKNRGPPESPVHVPGPFPNAQNSELNWQHL